jgi:two-component system NtrC family sensor kinase
VTSVATRLRSITSTLSFRLFVVISASTLFLFGAYVVVSTRIHGIALEQQIKTEAYRSSDFIRQSLLQSMLGDERAHTYQLMRLIGAEPGVEAVRIYNKQGHIRFSSAAEEIGTSVNLRAEACYGCHSSAEPLNAVPTAERARIYRKDAGYRVLGMINPIRNEEQCWNAACHAHTNDQSILGVLDVQMSMEPLDAAGARARTQALGLALVVVLLTAGLVALIVYRAVHVPTAKLRRGTDALRKGQLDVAIDLQRSDELGELAASFNRMARSVRRADAEVRSWSATLEERVREKTAELEQMNQQMIRIERTASLGRMAATVAHELNNPLSGILTYSKLVQRRVTQHYPDSTLRSQLLENLDLIRSESMRCGNIVRDLLTYARGRSAELAPAHLHPLIEQALRLVAHHVELRGIETVVELTLADDEVTCDREQIVQALLALFVNAVEAMPDGGTLTVRTETGQHPEEIVIRVNDTGVGMNADVQEHLFDPFFSTKNDAKGVGLGLAVVYGIVQRHEGEIRVESAPGKGARFAIHVPRDPAERAWSRGHPAPGRAVEA